MIDKLTKNITQFYQISFIAIMLAALGVIFYFWKLGFIDGSRGKELHKAGYTLERLQKKSPGASIKSSIMKEAPKRSVERIEALEKEVEALHRLVEDESYEKAFEELQRTKTAVANLISFQNSEKVISVFNEKMEKFSDFVVKNNWRTLTRMSQRVLNLTQKKLSGENLAKAVKTVEKDFNSMVKITENSVLSRAEKSEIISRITNLRTETEMLKKFLNEREFALRLADSYQTLFSKWLKTISPELSYQKLQVERMGRYYVMGMLGILALTSTLFFLGFLFNKWSFKKSQIWLEENLKELVADGIIGRGELKEELFSEDFHEFSQRTSEYVNKRMSFGAIFQDALPFSSLMLDKNLKVEWVNKQFCSDWEMSEEEASKDYMSWDYLSKLTNLGHDDPVLEALKNNVAGIYQIQIKPNENVETRPYEMFVSPVKYNNQKKIMLFFYPLLSMRETIKDQAISIVNPIDKTLRLLMDDKLDRTDKEQLRKEYEVGGIANILDMFEKLDAKASDEKRHLLNQIEMLYSSIEKKQASSDQAYELNVQAFSASKEQVKDLKAFREGVVSLAEAAKSFESFHHEQNQSFQEISNALEKAQNNFGVLKNSMEDISVSLPNLDMLKEAVKASRSETSERKAKLAQELANFIHVKKGISHPEVVKKFQAGYEKIYRHFQEMDHQFGGLEKRLVQLEVALSKAQMIMSQAQQSTEKLKKDQDAALVKSQKNKHALLREKALKLEGKTSESEAVIVESLQAIYKGYKENLKRQALIAKNLEVADQYQANNKSGAGASGETTM